MKKAKKGLLSVLGLAMSAVAALGAVWTVGAKDVEPIEASAAVAWDSWDGTAASGFAYGSGTSSSPYVIETAEQLAYLAQSVNGGNSYSGKYISLESNIDLCNIEWTPIGKGEVAGVSDYTTSICFSATFWGNGHIIENLNIHNTTTSYVGLFGVVQGDITRLSVSNVSFVNSVSYSIFIGGIAGFLRGGEITQCVVSELDITSSGTLMTMNGGIAGLVQQSAWIADCYATGLIEGNGYLGGIFGAAWNNGTTVSQRCYFRGDIKNTGTTSGGYIPPQACGIGSLMDGAVKCRDSFFVGTVSSAVTNCSVAAINADDRSYSINCYYSSNSSFNYSDGTSTSLSNFQSEAWLTSTLGWDFNDVWEIGADGYPVLQGFDGSNAVSHEFVEDSRVEPDCDTDGYIRYVCTDCGRYRYEALQKTGHTWTLVDTEEPTCTEVGYATYACDVCGDTKVEEIDAYGHSWNPVAVYHEPHCTEDGYWDVTCDRCGHQDVVINSNSATGHEYDDGTVRVQATCTEPGVVRYSCIHDGCNDYYEEFVQADHSAFVYEEYRVDANCWDDGYIHYACGSCSHTYDEVIESPGHQYEYTIIDEYTHEATCTACGNWICEDHHADRRVCVCGYRNSAYISILLIQDQDPWATDSNEDVLRQLLNEGKIDAWEKKSTSQILSGNVDFTNYSLILFANDQGSRMYSNYEQFADELEAYVEGGGALVFGACDSGWLTGTINVPLPGGATTAVKYDHNNYIVDETSPIVTGEYTDGTSLLESQLYGNYCSHNYFTSIPDNANVIFENSNGRPTLIEYTLGDGYVIASGLTWEFYVYRTSFIAVDFADVAYDDLIMTALSKTGAYDPSFEKYLVEFKDYDDTLLKAQRVEKDHTPDMPENPEREGYTFKGWDVNSDGEVDYVDSLPTVTEAMQFTAVYEVNTYRVTVTASGNGSVEGGGNYTYGGAAVLTAEAEENYKFDGWYLDGVCLSRETLFIYTVGAGDVEIEGLFVSEGVGAEVEITADKPAYQQGEEITVTLTLKNITQDSGISSVILTELRCNGSALSVMQINENAYLTAAQFVGSASGWTAVADMTSITVYGPAVTQDGEVAVEISVVITAQRDTDLVFEVIGSGVNGNGDACEIKFTALTIGVTCAHGNTYIDNYIDPTCHTLGYTGDTYCYDCGEFVEAGEDIWYVEHSYVYFNSVEATCYMDGGDYEICEYCQHIQLANVIPAGHLDMVEVLGHDATCTEDGLTDGVFCNACGDWVVAQEIIVAVGHVTVVEPGREPTCQQEGLTDGEYCEVCGEWIVPQLPIPSAHVAGEWQPCEYDQFGRVAKEEIVCTICGLQLDLRIPAPEHPGEVIVEGHDATCDGQDGLTDGVWCEDCQEWVIPQEVIPGGHIESDWIEKYDENGKKYEEKVCERCGLQLDLRIPYDDGEDIHDNSANVGAINVGFGCAGIVGMTGILPIALVGGMMLIRRRKDDSEE